MVRNQFTSVLLFYPASTSPSQAQKELELSQSHKSTCVGPSAPMVEQNTSNSTITSENCTRKHHSTAVKQLGQRKVPQKGG